MFSLHDCWQLSQIVGNFQGGNIWDINSSSSSPGCRCSHVSSQGDRSSTTFSHRTLTAFSLSPFGQLGVWTKIRAIQASLAIYLSGDTPGCWNWTSLLSCYPLFWLALNSHFTRAMYVICYAVSCWQWAASIVQTPYYLCNTCNNVFYFHISMFS